MTFTTDQCRFVSTDNFLLAGLLFKPVEETKKVALYLHGNGSMGVFESVEKTQTFAKTLTKNGIAFFPFNNRGCGYIRSLKKIDDQGKETRSNGGTAYELIKDCIKDIDGAIHFLQKKGFTEFYLIGESTGANKIVVYDYYKKENSISKYVLLSGGDDTGIYFDMLGQGVFYTALEKAQQEIESGNGEELVPKEFEVFMLSWQSLYDTINPEGDYNIFPYNDYFNTLHLSKKELFREFKRIKKPTLVMYGENDEYCYGKVPEIVTHLDNIHQMKVYKSVIIPNADHGLTGKLDEGATIIANWLHTS